MAWDVQGNTRTKVLGEGGYPVNDLPREVVRAIIETSYLHGLTPACRTNAFDSGRKRRAIAQSAQSSLDGGVPMEKFTTLSGVAAPLPIVNLDTDKIFPAIFLKTIKRTGLAQWLFHEIRFRPDGSEEPDFVLNQAPYRNARI